MIWRLTAFLGWLSARMARLKARASSETGLPIRAWRQARSLLLSGSQEASVVLHEFTGQAHSHLLGAASRCNFILAGSGRRVLRPPGGRARKWVVGALFGVL